MIRSMMVKEDGDDHKEEDDQRVEADEEVGVKIIPYEDWDDREDYDDQRAEADEEVGVPRINPSAAAPASRLLSSSFNWNPCRHHNWNHCHNWNHLYIIGRFCVSVCMSRFCLFFLTPLMGKLFWQVGKLFWQVGEKIILAGQLMK